MTETETHTNCDTDLFTDSPDPDGNVRCIECGRPERPVWMTVHRLSREFGGPEEGGWWFDAGEVELSITLAELDGDEIFTLYNLMLKLYPRTHESGKIVPQRGDFTVTFGFKRGEDFPEEPPYYS